MDRIQITATFSDIPPDEVAAFKAAAAEATEIAKGEAYVLSYNWFAVNDEETTFKVLEDYESSDAVLTHLAAVGAQVGAMLATGATLAVEVFGDPSPALLEAGAAFSPAIYPYFVGK